MEHMFSIGLYISILLFFHDKYIFDSVNSVLYYLSTSNEYKSFVWF